MKISLRLTAPDDILISRAEISTTIQEIADYYNSLFKDIDVLTTLTVLHGARPFADTLIPLLHPTIVRDEIKVSSMDGAASTGSLRFETEPHTDLKDKDVLIIEDLVDTGLTLSRLIEYLHTIHHVKSVNVVALFEKPECRIPDYKIPNLKVGISVANKFIVGFGLDWNGRYRELPYLTTAKETKPGFWEPAYSEAA